MELSDQLPLANCNGANVPDVYTNVHFKLSLVT